MFKETYIYNELCLIKTSMNVPRKRMDAAQMLYVQTQQGRISVLARQDLQGMAEYVQVRYNDEVS